ncbi:MAG: hypothetical protein KGK09_01505, partial [Burkholderiales bacterium]|nr:hypothetical protein [Burkholderiales bacterium]
MQGAIPGMRAGARSARRWLSRRCDLRRLALPESRGAAATAPCPPALDGKPENLPVDMSVTELDGPIVCVRLQG